VNKLVTLGKKECEDEPITMYIAKLPTKYNKQVGGCPLILIFVIGLTSSIVYMHRLLSLPPETLPFFGQISVIILRPVVSLKELHY
jgi:hypothetical protein